MKKNEEDSVAREETNEDEMAFEDEMASVNVMGRDE